LKRSLFLREQVSVPEEEKLLKKHGAYIGNLRTTEKTDLLQVCYTILLQKHGLFRCFSFSARSVDGLAGGVDKNMLWSEQACMRVTRLDKRAYSLLDSITM
jgi:hypothetical protein